MAAIRTILYFGKDDEFHTQLKDFTSKHLRRDFDPDGHAKVNQTLILYL